MSQAGRLAAMVISISAALGCNSGGQFCRRDLPDGGCDLYVTTDHCPDCPSGFVPISNDVAPGCVASTIGCK